MEVPRSLEEDPVIQPSADKSRWRGSKRGLRFGDVSALVACVHQENKAVCPFVTPPSRRLLQLSEDAAPLPTHSEGSA